MSMTTANSAEVPASPASPKRLTLPHVFPFNTRPLTDLKVVILLLPILWVFGLEQVLPPVLLFWAAFKLILRGPKLRVPWAFFPFLLFVAWQIAPQVLMETSRDWVVFIRSVITYGSVLCVLLIVANDARRLRDAEGVVWALVGLGAMASVIGLLFAAGLLPESFNALLIGSLLPGLLRSSTFVQESIMIREIGATSAEFGSLTYPRVFSIFLSANNAAIGFTTLLFSQWYFVLARRGTKRLIVLGLFLLTLLIFLLTGSRMAWLAFMGSFGFMLVLRYQGKFRLPVIALPLLLIAAIAVAIYFLLANEPVQQLINTLFLDVRADSFRDRLILYENTFALWAERPLAGWGTPRTVTSVTLAPVGTHGEFIGALFRSGLVGFLLYTTTIVFVWMQLALRIGQARRARNGAVLRLILIVTATFLSANLMHLTYNFYWDFSVALLTWSMVALCFSPLIVDEPEAPSAEIPSPISTTPS